MARLISNLPLDFPYERVIRKKTAFEVSEFKILNNLKFEFLFLQLDSSMVLSRLLALIWSGIAAAYNDFCHCYMH